MATIQRIQCGNGNCFLVEEKDNAVLVDASRTKYMDKILDACRGKNVRVLLLTHGHIDHVQNAADLAERLHVPIAMHKEDYALLKNTLFQPLYAHKLMGKFILRLSIKSFEQDSIKPFAPSLFLEDGDTLEACGINASIIALPGHTKGSVGILVDQTDFIVGDALMNILYPSKSMLYNNRNEMEKSAAKISNSPAKIIHFGHGKSVSNRKW